MAVKLYYYHIDGLGTRCKPLDTTELEAMVAAGTARRRNGAYEEVRGATPPKAVEPIAEPTPTREYQTKVMVPEAADGAPGQKVKLKPRVEPKAAE